MTSFLRTHGTSLNRAEQMSTRTLYLIEETVNVSIWAVSSRDRVITFHARRSLHVFIISRNYLSVNFFLKRGKFVIGSLKISILRVGDGDRFSKRVGAGNRLFLLHHNLHKAPTLRPPLFFFNDGLCNKNQYNARGCFKYEYETGVTN